MARNIYHNYDFYTDFSGHSVVVHDDKGIIVETELPFKKWIGHHIDDMVNHYRDRKSFNGMNDLGQTVNSRLVNNEHLRSKK